jgi:hypothetical protein
VSFDARQFNTGPNRDGVKEVLHNGKWIKRREYMKLRKNKVHYTQ